LSLKSYFLRNVTEQDITGAEWISFVPYPDF